MNRTTTALAVVLSLMALFQGCGNPPPPLPPGAMGPEIVQGGAVFRYRNADARTIHLVGDFNSWDATLDPMNDENGDGEWTLYYPLTPGTYVYKFVIDSKRWVADPTNPLREPDGFDGDNSILKIPETYNQ